MNQFFTFMIDWTLKSAVTVALGFVGVLLLRRRSATAQNLVCRTTLAALALLPLAMALLAKAGTPAVMEAIQAPVRTMIAPITPPRPTHTIKNPRFAAIFAQQDMEGTFGTRLAIDIYAAGLAAMLVVWAAGYFRIRGIAKGGSAAEEVSSTHRVIVAIDPELRVPITFGLFRPVIVLPRESREWPEERVRAAILHESAHISRNDWAWQTGALLLRAVQWVNPAVWLMSAALQSTSEAAADDEVLMQFSMAPTAYAGELLKVAESASGNFAVATPMARRGGVSSRLRRIVANGIERERPHQRFRIGLVCVFAAAGLLVAAGTVAEAAGDGVVPGGHPLSAGPLTDLLGSAVASFHRHDESFEAKLAHGGVVRMVAMSWDGAKGQLWGPDGALAPAADKRLIAPAINLSNWPGTAIGKLPPNGRVLNLFLQVSKLPMKPGDTENGIFRVTPSSEDWQYRMGSNVSSNDGRLQWDQWVAPITDKTFDMDCAITYGPYTVIGRGSLGDGQFDSKVEPQGDSVQLTLTIPAKYGQTQTLLQCYDQNGIQVSGMGGPLEGQKDDRNGDVKWDFWLKASDAKRVKTYELKIRQYEHVVLRGIHVPQVVMQP